MLDLRDIVAAPQPQGQVRPESVGQGPLDWAGEGVKKLLDLLDLPAHGVHTVLGGGNRQNFYDAVNTTAKSWETLGPQLAANPALRAAPGGAVAQAALQNMPNVGRLAVHLGTDPLNLIGGNIPSKLRAAGVGGTNLAPTLKLLENSERLTQNFLDMLIAGWARGVNLTNPFTQEALNLPRAQLPKVGGFQLPELNLNKLPGAADVTRAVPRVPLLPIGHQGLARELPIQDIPGLRSQRPAVQVRVGEPENLYEQLFSRSKQSAYRLAVRQLQDAAGMLTRGGFDLDREAVDVANILSGKPAIAQMGVKNYALSQGEHELRKQQTEFMAKVAAAPNAEARVGALEVLRQIEVLNARAWEKARDVSRQAGVGQPAGRAPTGGKARGIHRTMYRQGVNDSLANYSAGNTLLDQLYENSTKLAPEIEGQIEAMWAPTLREIQTKQITPATGLFPPSVGPLPKVARTEETPPIREQLGQLQARRDQVSATVDRFRRFADAILPDEAFDLTGIGQVGGHLQRRLGQLEELRAGKPGALEDLPVELHGPFRDAEKRLVKYGAQARAAQQGFEDMMRTLWTEYNPGAKWQDLGIPIRQRKPEDIRDFINTKLAQMPAGTGLEGAQIENTQDFLELLQGKVDRELFEKFQKRVTAFGGADLLHSNPLEAAVDRAARQMQGVYGITEDKSLLGGLAEPVKNANALFRTQALASIAYPLVNYSGILFQSTLAGIPTGRLLENTLRNIPKALRGEDTTPEHIAKWVDRFEPGILKGATGDPSLVYDATSESMRRITGKGVGITEKIGAPKLAGLGGLLGAYEGVSATPEDADMGERARNVALSAGIGAATGGVYLPKMEKYILRRLSVGLEDVGRKEVYFTGANEALEKLRPQFQAVIERAFTTPTRRLTSQPSGTLEYVENLTQAPAGNVPGQLRAFLDEQNWLLKSDTVANLLRVHGVDAQHARTAQKQWRDLQYQAAKTGEALSKEVHFDYGDLNNVQEFLREFAPFSTWAMKALPFFARHLAEKPGILAAMADLQRSSEEQRKAEGAPLRTANAMHMPLGDYVWSRLLSLPVQAYYNPFRQFLPFAEAGRALRDQPDQTPWEVFLSLLQAGGMPQPTPPVAIGARVLGLGGDDPPANLVRMAAPVQGATALAGLNRGRGFDLNAPIADFERRLRELGIGSATGPQEVADPGLSNVLKKIDELALSDLGHPLGQGGPGALVYQRAKVERKGPVWDEAARLAARERGMRGIAGFIYSPLAPQALVSAPEAAAGELRKERVLDPAFVGALRDNAAQRPTEQAPPDWAPSMRQAILQFQEKNFGQTYLAPEVEARLQKNTYSDLNWLQKKLTELEIQARPGAQLYGQGGSPEEMRLSNLLSLYMNLGSAVPGGAELQRVQKMMPSGPGFPDTTPSRNSAAGMIQSEIGKLKQSLAGETPLLERYLKWKAANPDGNAEEYLKQVRSGRAQ